MRSSFEVPSKVSDTTILSITFYLLLIATTVSYIGYYLYFYRNDINVLALYYVEQLSYPVGIFAIFFRFLKDILILLLFFESLIIAIIHNGKINVPMLITAMMLLYGTFVSLIRRQTVWNIAAGIRSYFYLLAILIFFSISFSVLKLRTIYRLCFLSLFVNFFVGLEQTYRGTGHNFFLAGKQIYRFTGLFGSSAGWGVFLAAFSVLLFMSHNQLKLRRWTILSLIILIILSSIMTGSRSSMINLVVIIVLWILDELPIEKKQRQALIIFGLMITLPIAIVIASQVASRGSILQVQLESGRLNIFENIITNSSNIELIFGHGIGEGNNSNVMLGYSNANSKGLILDGSLNVLFYHFGIIGMVPITLIFILGICNILKKSTISSFIVFICTIVLQGLTVNIFESYSFLIITAVNYALMTENGCIDIYQR